MRSMRNNRGFTSLRTIIALIVTLTILPIAVNIIAYTSSIKFEYDLINDELSIYQLRRIMLIAYDVYNDGNSLNFIYHNDDYSLSEINGRLVLKPGYQVFLDNIDYLEFIEEGDAVWLRYEKDNKEYRTPIVKKRGIYISDFLNLDDVDNNNYSSGE